MTPLVSVGLRRVLNVRLRDLQPEGGVPDHFGALYWGQTWALSLRTGGELSNFAPPVHGWGHMHHVVWPPRGMEAWALGYPGPPSSSARRDTATLAATTKSLLDRRSHGAAAEVV